MDWRCCPHRTVVAHSIDLVCSDCGLVVDTRPFGEETTTATAPGGARTETRAFSAEIGKVIEEIGSFADTGKIERMSTGGRTGGRLRTAAIARVSAVFRKEMPIDLILHRTGTSFKQAKRALAFEGVDCGGDDDDVWVDWVFSRDILLGIPEARRDFEAAMRACGDRMHVKSVLAAVLHDWIKDEDIAAILGVSARAIEAHRCSFERKRR